MAFATHVPAGVCARGPQSGAVALMKYLIDERKDGARNWGIYNCRLIGGLSIRSVHGEGRALDIGFTGLSNPAGTRLVRDLLSKDTVGKLGVQLIIWNRLNYSARHPTGTRHLGQHPHLDHVHLELSWPAARGLTVAIARAAFGGTPPTPAVSGRPNATFVVNAWRAGLEGRWINPGSVKAVQQRLATKGHVTTPDGKYGKNTTARVLDYQRRFSALSNDGIAGQQTITHLWR
jgi:hypothetical protein